MSVGEWLSLGSAVSWALAVVIFTRCGASVSPHALNFFKNVFTVGLLLPTHILVTGGFGGALSGFEIAVLLLSGFLGISLGDSVYFMALNRIGAARTGIIASLYSPFVILLSLQFLGESLVWLQVLGFVGVLAGVFLVSYTTHRKQISDRELHRGALLAVLAVFLMAIGVVMIKRILEQHELTWLVLIRTLAGAAGVPLILLLQGQMRAVLGEFRQPLPWGQMTLGAFLGTYVGLVLWLAGYKYADASIASILNETAAIFIVVFSWLFLQEEISRRKAVGVVLAFSGVVLLALGG